MNHGEFDHGQEGRGELLMPGGDAAAALQPADAPLDDVAASVLAAIQRVTPLVASSRDHRFDATSGAPGADAAGAISLVARDRIGPTPPRDVDRVHHALEVG